MTEEVSDGLLPGKDLANSTASKCKVINSYFYSKLKNVLHERKMKIWV